MKSTGSILRKKGSIDYLFYVICLLFLVSNNYQFKNNFYFIHIALFILMFLLMPFTSDFQSIVLSRYFILIILIYLFFIFSFLAGHGIKERYISNIIIFTKSIPLFILGFMIAKDRAGQFWIIAPVLLFLALIGIMDIALLRNYSAGYNREELAYLLAGNGQTRFMSNAMGKSADDFISYYPYLALFTVFAILPVLHFTKGIVVRLALLGCCFILLVQILMSGWTTPTLLFAIGLVILLTLSGIQSLKRFVGYALLGLFASLIIYSVLTSFEIGETARVVTRLNLLYDSLTQPQYFDSADKASGGRFYLMGISWDAFLTAPIFGIGAANNTGLVGDHSFIVDTLGMYGIIGFLIIAGLPISWACYALRNFIRDRRDTMNIACLACLIAFLIGSFINPYFITSYIDQLTFLIGGIVSGGRLFYRVQPQTSLRT